MKNFRVLVTCEFWVSAETEEEATQAANEYWMQESCGAEYIEMELEEE